LVYIQIDIIGVERGTKPEMNHIPQTKDSITLRDKAIFTGIIIILIVIIAILINQYYYNSLRDNLMSTDFFIALATPDFDYDKAYIITVSNSRGS
jgi:cell division protein FtsL